MNRAVMGPLRMLTRCERVSEYEFPSFAKIAAVSS